MKRLIRPAVMLLLVFTLLNFAPLDASAKSSSLTTHIGTVNASALNLRSGPSTGASILSSAPKNDYVMITGKTGNWLHVSHNLVSGYMHEAYLNLHTAKNVELGYGTVNANKVNLRSGPGTHYKILAQTQKGDQAYIIGFNKQWFKVICKGQVCYIRSDYLTLTEIPYENQKSNKDPIFFVNGKSTGLAPSAEALSGTSSSSLRSQIVSNAKKHLGTPYVWGGNQPGGFDCSGFTEYIYKQSGISLPRTTTEQYQKGHYVDKGNLQPGDLVFLANTYRSGISHVGIYIGNGSMIHASSSKGITISDLSSSYYTKHYYGSRRVIA